MINTVLTVGCSFTYGQELNRPAADAWPALLATKNNWNVTNMGKCGGSNDYIMRTVIEETCTNNYDLIIVEWSEPGRFEVWDVIGNKALDIAIRSGHLGRRDMAWAHDYYKNGYCDFHSYRKTAIQYLALQGYLNSIGQRYIFTNLSGLRNLGGKWDSLNPDLSHLWSKVDDTYFPGWPHDGFVEWQGDCPKGPGGHPLELGHQRIAERINEHIRHLGWVS